MVSVYRLPWITVHCVGRSLKAMAHQIVYVSATPGDYGWFQTTIIEQIIRQTRSSRSPELKCVNHGGNGGSLR